MRTYIAGIVVSLTPFLLCAYDNQYIQSRSVEHIPIEQYKDLPLTKAGPWRPVQKKVHDTVVQVFSMIAEFDWLQPYRTPNQHAVRGSGFFINEEGDIITNAHVVDQAVAVWIHIPSLGKRPIRVHIVGVCPERDIALLRVADEDLNIIRDTLGCIPYLEFGDSDTIYRADEVLALGYPLGQETLKCTSGIISGREQAYIQISAPINPGSSGGPLLNIEGKVIGINSSGFLTAQNVGYAIPINILKVIIHDLYKIQLLRKPYLGILAIHATDELTSYLGNPQPGGCYVVEVVKNSPLEKSGIQAGDMIYEINNYRLDIYGEMSVPWSEDKISFAYYISRLALCEEINIVAYRHGEKIETKIIINNTEVAPIRKMYPWFESIDYEVFAGMVVMPLTVNHIRLFADSAPGLKLYTIPNQTERILVITHIFPDSALAQAQSITEGSTINEINDMPVHTLDDFRNAIKLSRETKQVVIKTTDQMSRTSENVLAVLPFDAVCKEVSKLAQVYRYPISETVQELISDVQE